MKLVSHQVALAQEILKRPKNIIRTPSGIGANYSICSALSKVDGSILIIDSVILHKVWERDLRIFGVEAKLVGPEKLRYDLNKGVEYPEYDNVVWSAFNCGQKTVEAVSRIVNKARRVWITHLQKPSALLSLNGPFNLIMMDFRGNSIYPTLSNDPSVLKKMEKFLSGMEGA